MPSTKTDTSLRFPQSADQRTRIWDVTQNQRAAARAQAQADSSASKQQQQQESQNLSPNQLLAEHMDQSGSPVPDPVTGAQGKGGRGAKASEDEPDLYEAMNANFD